MNKILIAVDGSPASDAAVRSGLGFAASENAAVLFVHVAPELDAVPGAMFGTTGAIRHELSANDRVSLDAALDAAEADGVAANGRLLVGEPAEEIVAFADSAGVDLIVVGSRRLGAVGRVLLGSVSGGVLRESRGPVLVVTTHEVVT